MIWTLLLLLLEGALADLRRPWREFVEACEAFEREMALQAARGWP